MRILIVGVTGLIGSALAHRLAADGHEVVGVARRARPTVPVLQRLVALDLGDVSEAHWLEELRGVDAVVNCAGLLQDGPGARVADVHAQGVRTLAAACERAGVRRVIHLSALGVDRRQATAFAATKKAGEEALSERNLDWVILRPSVVLGRPAYGGSALLRGLAALPVLPSMPGTRPMRVVALDDLLTTIVFFLSAVAPSRLALDLEGPRAWSFDALVALHRRWLGWPPARPWKLPGWAARLAFALGDLAGRLGWRPPLRSTARIEIGQAEPGDPARWQELTGIAPRDLEQVLLAEPASVQERWFARLYLLKALLFVVLPLFWIATGVVALGPGWKYGMGLMEEGGVTGFAAAAVIVASALADIAIGALIAWRPTARRGLYAALAITVIYSIVGTVLVPRLWLDPMGPLLKVPPILVLHFAALAVVEDR